MTKEQIKTLIRIAKQVHERRCRDEKPTSELQ